MNALTFFFVSRASDAFRRALFVTAADRREVDERRASSVSYPHCATAADTAAVSLELASFEGARAIPGLDRIFLSLRRCASVVAYSGLVMLRVC